MCARDAVRLDMGLSVETSLRDTSRVFALVSRLISGIVEALQRRRLA